MKNKIYMSTLLLLVLLPLIAYADDFDDAAFEYMSYLTVKNQIKLYKDFCSGDKNYLNLVLEAEKVFIKNSPRWIEIENNPPENSPEIKDTVDRENVEMNKMMREALAQAPRDVFCEGFSDKLKIVTFSDFLKAAKAKIIETKEKARNSPNLSQPD